MLEQIDLTKTVGREEYKEKMAGWSRSSPVFRGSAGSLVFR